MTATVPRAAQIRPYPARRQVKGTDLARILRTTDAKQIGIMYMITSFVFFILGGLMALLMRAELALYLPNISSALVGDVRGSRQRYWFAVPRVLLVHRR